MSDRICVCGKKFRYPCLLQRHIKYTKCNTLQSSSLEENIEQASQEGERKIVACRFCNKKFNKKFNATRHEEICQEQKSGNRDSYLLNLLIERLEKQNLEIKNLQEENKDKERLISLMVQDLSRIYKQPMYKILEKYSSYHNESFSKINNLSNKQENCNIEALHQDKPITKLPRQENIFKTEPVKYYKSLFDSSDEDENNEKILKNNKNNDTNTYNDNMLEVISLDDILSKAERESNFIPFQNTSNISTTTNSHNSICSNSNNQYNISITSTSNLLNDDTIPYVYPFGYENINFLKNEEMLEILKSSEGSQLVIDKIYSQLTNQNFMIMNKKDLNIAVIEKNFTIRYYRLGEFARKLFENSITLLKRIFHRCQHKLNVEHKMIVFDNINYIEDTLSAKKELYEIYEIFIANITNNTENKKTFSNLRLKLEQRDKEVIKKCNEALRLEAINLEKYFEDMSHKSITKEDILEQIWEPVEDSSDMELDSQANNLHLHRVIDTARYKKIKELEKDEIDLVSQNGGLLGDVQTLYKLRQNRERDEANLLKTSHSLNNIEEKDIEELYKKKSNLSELSKVRFMKNNEIRDFLQN